MDSAFIRAVSDFIFAEDPPEKADIILLPGSFHEEHVLRAAELYHDGFAQLILPSGRYAKAQGRCSIDGYESEWAWMRDVLRWNGVPGSAILREDRATYTWENAQLSRAVTDSLGLRVRTALLACRAHHARRALFYYQAAFPETRILVCPAASEGRGREDWFTTPAGRAEILGELRRLGDQIREVFEDRMGRQPV